MKKTKKNSSSSRASRPSSGMRKIRGLRRYLYRLLTKIKRWESYKNKPEKSGRSWNTDGLTKEANLVRKLLKH